MVQSLRECVFPLVKYRHKRSSKPLRNDFANSSSDEAFMVTSNVQYYQMFCLDSLGQPLVDANPQLTEGWHVPLYTVIFHEALPIDETEKPSQNRAKRSKATCWNCGEEGHSLRDCPYPRDPEKISLAKKEFMEQSAENLSLNQRYHKEGEEGGFDQRFAKFRPGQISDDLREALGLDRQQIPPYIFQMRLLGYPPGYLKQAEVMKSGLTVYDIKDGDEPGQIHADEADTRPTYDPLKLIEYPGFNIALPDGVREPEGVPPMHPAHSKQAFQLFMTPPRVSDNGQKRARSRDFTEDPSKKRPRFERVEVDMEVDEANAADFKPPLPPTPIPETPPPLPSSTPPPTPGTTPRFTSVDMPSELLSVRSPGSTDVEAEDASQSSATPGSVSPSMDDLERMQSRLREALMQAATDDGSITQSDASDKFVVDGEEFFVESVSDESEETEERALHADEDVPKHASSCDEDIQTQSLESRSPEGTSFAKEECELSTFEDVQESGTLTEQEASLPTSERTAEDRSEEAEEEESKAVGGGDDLVPGELAEGSLDTTPNRSGVPHLSKFAVGISPHENENLTETTGILKRILSIFKRKKGKPSS
ncbi:zinc finger CCHC domain-containing protein 8-like isoform X2 [Acanthaster planci]|uniref:Zinc finger CCHC domain-containing protein 8-like isoform X2 n=1 Tax=Acanthaster planci TaxID=133434 RepID=A0A8B7YYM4_ACAPL|nr:zinc finger CCHC domain-containing protein 8-like isoform X2 [Acanthaster planci]